MNDSPRPARTGAQAGPLDCERARRLASAGFDGEAERSEALAAHLRSCAPCLRFAEGCGAIAQAFAPLRAAQPPAGLEARLHAGAAAARPTAPAALFRLRGGAMGARVAAGLVGMAAIGALCAWAESRRSVARAPVASGWLEPLAPQALPAADERLRAWSGSLAVWMSEERR